MPIDILLDSSYDADTATGDFKIGEATRQHQTLLLLAEKGEMRDYPGSGVGLNTYELDDITGDLAAVIKKEFENDGMTVSRVYVNGDKINADGQYNS
jgi:hypothetical protein